MLHRCCFPAGAGTGPGLLDGASGADEVSGAGAADGLRRGSGGAGAQAVRGSGGAGGAGAAGRAAQGLGRGCLVAASSGMAVRIQA
jgi:hypothetical protein